MSLYVRPVQMEDSVEGVDWHRNGADVPVWLMAVLFAVIGVPALAAGALIVVAWLA